MLNCIERFFVTAAVLCSRCTCIDTRHAQKACRKWSLEMDVALVQYINRLCRHLAITPARLHPHEVYLDPSDIADPRVACLLSKYTCCAFFLSYVLTRARLSYRLKGMPCFEKVTVLQTVLFFSSYCPFGVSCVP